jgi:hypothetical protein
MGERERRGNKREEGKEERGGERRERRGKKREKGAWGGEREKAKGKQERT